MEVHDRLRKEQQQSGYRIHEKTINDTDDRNFANRRRVSDRDREIEGATKRKSNVKPFFGRANKAMDIHRIH